MSFLAAKVHFSRHFLVHAALLLPKRRRICGVLSFLTSTYHIDIENERVPLNQEETEEFMQIDVKKSFYYIYDYHIYDKILVHSFRMT